MTRVLITGAGGQLGQSLKQLSKVYSHLDFDFKSADELDITQAEQVTRTFAFGAYDYCINCAAYTAVAAAEVYQDKAFAVNADGVRNLAISCKKHQAVLIHISTDYVFDGTKEEGYLPTDHPNPINTYGRSKLAGEKQILKILEAYYIVRTSWLYSEFGKNFYTTILEKAIAGEVLEVTVTQRGCPTHAGNLGIFLLESLVKQTPAYGIYHFTDGEAMTWFEFAKRILRENNLEKVVEIQKTTQDAAAVKRPKTSVLLHTAF